MTNFDIFLDIEDNRWTAAINDIAATIADVFNVPLDTPGKSFKEEIL